MADYLRDKYYPGAHTLEEMDAMDKARKETVIEAEVRLDNEGLVQSTKAANEKQVVRLLGAALAVFQPDGSEESYRQAAQWGIDALRAMGFIVVADPTLK